MAPWGPASTSSDSDHPENEVRQAVKSFTERYQGAALITGASSGIGAALARALAARGMDLILLARRESRPRDLADAVAKDHGVRTHLIVQDLFARDAAKAIRDEVEQSGLQVGLLVNNAGFSTYGSFHEVADGSQARMVDLHCGASIALTETFLPDMVARGRGGIIFVSSMAGFQPTPFMATYGATKAFKLSLAEALWAELKPQGVDVLGLCPGYVATEFQEVAGTQELPHPRAMPAEAIAEKALRVLGRRPSLVPGIINSLTAGSVRFLPRRWVAALAARALRPKRGTAPRELPNRKGSVA